MYTLFTNPKEEALQQLVRELFESKQELLVEGRGNVLTHLTHLEDLTLTGREKFVETVRELLRTSRQVEGPREGTVVEKIDGAPSLFFLKDPRSGKFGVSTKSISAQAQKIAHNTREVRKLFPAPGLQEKLIAALYYLSKLELNGAAFQGDVLFTKEDVRKKRIKGKDYLVFTPNVIQYAVPIDSSSTLYQDVVKAEFGIVVHTFYKVEQEGDGLKLERTWNKTAIDGLVKQAQGIDGLFLIDPWHPQIEAPLSEEETGQVEKLLEELETINYKVPTVLTRQFFERFVNFLVRAGEIPAEAGELQKAFLQFLEEKQAEEVDKKKTDKGKESVGLRFEKVKQEVGSRRFFSFLQVYELALEVKKIFLNLFSKVHSKLGATFLGDELTEPEGFVLSTGSGNLVKLVDRSQFSKANFLFGAFNKQKGE